MDEFRFRKWGVYEDSQKLFAFLLKIVDSLPKEYRYSLGDQIVRAGFSIILNIAEGSGKSSDAELKRFINIAIGSAYEVLAAMDTVEKIGFINKEDYGVVEEMVASICRQLGGFKKYAGIKKT